MKYERHALSLCLSVSLALEIQKTALKRVCSSFPGSKEELLQLRIGVLEVSKTQLGRKHPL